MSLIAQMTGVDLLFLGSVATLAVAAGAARPSSETVGPRAVATVGWAAFAAFWTVEAASYLSESRVFLATVSLATAGVCGYVGTLAARDRPDWTRFTAAFAAMGLLFAPYQYVVPVFHAVLGLVTDHTVWGLGVVGFDPTVGVGLTGQPTALRFRNYPRLRYNIVSACTGFSAVALFGGLVLTASESRRRRLAVALGAGGFVYLANVVRTVLVGAAVGGEWFAFAAPVITPLFGVTEPALVSFYFAEYLLAQSLVVVVLVALYAAVARALPSVDDDVGALLAAFRADLARARSRVRRRSSTDGEAQR